VIGTAMKNIKKKVDAIREELKEPLPEHQSTTKEKKRMATKKKSRKASKKVSKKVSKKIKKKGAKKAAKKAVDGTTLAVRNCALLVSNERKAVAGSSPASQNSRLHGKRSACE
jgi:hypothetical protein